MDVQEELRQKYLLLFPHLNGRQQQLLAAADAERLGKGGVTLAARASGFSRPAIYQALRDLHGEPLPAGRVRRAGAGRKRLAAQDPELVRELQGLFEPHLPEEALPLLSWTCKTTRQLAQSVTEKGHSVSHEMVARLLREMGYRLPANSGRARGVPRPDRENQFRHLLNETMRFAGNGWPVLAVEIEPRPRSNRGAHAPDRSLQDAWALHHAAEAVRLWWQSIGLALFPEATAVLVCLDPAGQAPGEPTPWQAGLQRWVDRADLELTVGLLPPGTYRWERPTYPTRNRFGVKWGKEGELDCEVSVCLGAPPIGELDQQAHLQRALTALRHPAPLPIQPHDTRGEWNYSLRPVKPV